MKPHLPHVPSPRPLRGARALAALVLSSLAGACASASSRPPGGGDVEILAEKLVLAAQERTDLRPLRVWVASVRSARDASSGSGQPADDELAGRLEQELVYALAMRVNVVEPDIDDAQLVGVTAASVKERAAACGATHVVVADYVRQREGLVATVRLIDAETRLIVAAARGEVRLGALSDAAAGGSRRPSRRSSAFAAAPEDAEKAPAQAQQQEQHPWAVVAGRPQPEIVLPDGAAPAPGTASGVAPSSAAAPAAEAASTRAAPPPAGTAQYGARSDTRIRSWPIEDFETWRKRRIAEQEAERPALPPAERPQASTEDAVRARTDALAEDPEYPWRTYGWLARLLRVPEARTQAR